jgi:hypothetical protein
MEIDQARLLVMRAAWVMEMHGNKAARVDVSAIKVSGGPPTTWPPQCPRIEQRQGTPARRERPSESSSKG